MGWTMPDQSAGLRRRALLGFGAAAALAGVTGSGAVLTAGVNHDNHHGPPKLVDPSKLGSIAGKAYRPGDPGYAEQLRTYNRSLVQRPGLVVAAAAPGDVQAAVRYAGARDMPVGVLTTGHQNSVPIG